MRCDARGRKRERERKKTQFHWCIHESLIFSNRSSPLFRYILKALCDIMWIIYLPFGVQELHSEHSIDHSNFKSLYEAMSYVWLANNIILLLFFLRYFCIQCEYTKKMNSRFRVDSFVFCQMPLNTYIYEISKHWHINHIYKNVWTLYIWTNEFHILVNWSIFSSFPSFILFKLF